MKMNGTSLLVRGLVMVGLTMSPLAAQQISKTDSPTLTDGKSTEHFVSQPEDYGSAVAISGEYAFVSEPNSALEAGGVTVLSRDAGSGQWDVLVVLKADPGEIGDRFGSSLDAAGDRLIVGAPGALEGFGAAYVYQRQAGGDWVQETVLTGEDLPPGSGFGQRSVAISGNLAAVGTGFPGIGFIFEYDTLSGEWGIIGELDTDSDPPDWIAYKVALTHQRLATTALFANGQEGAVLVIEADTVTGEAVIIGNFTVPGSFRFGRDLAISGDIIVVGQQAEDGSAFIFEYDGAAWNQTHTWDFFSGGVDVSDETVIAGNTPKSEATIFRKAADSMWVVDGVLVPGTSGSGFGADVDMSGDYAIVGQPRWNSTDPGLASIFERTQEGTWELVSETEGEGSLFPSITGGTIECEAAGKASVFPCSEIDLVSYVNLPDLLASGERMSDIWGWTDPETGREYAISTHLAGATFVDITDAENPVVLGVLPIHEGSSASKWHDVKVYADHAFLVADGAGPAGMQIFDLTQLRSVNNPPVQFEETAHYDKIGSSHNIAINEETAVAYIVGANGSESGCGGGLHMVDISDPTAPEFLNCYADPATGSAGTGYTHDVECLVYDGPDQDYQGDEICFGSNETAIQITNVTDRRNPVTIAVATYPTATYVHQGWLSEDGKYFYQDDELDESAEKPLPTTFIWDVADLDDPVLVSRYDGVEAAIDHNQYIKGGHLYQANYASGLRILELSDPVAPVEVAFFDTAPARSTSFFGGAWSSYPFFESGNIVVNSSTEGMFVLRPTNLKVGVATEAVAELPEGYVLSQNYPNPFNPSTQIQFSVPERTKARLTIVDELGRTVAELAHKEVSAGTHTVVWDAEGFASGVYHYRLEAGQIVLVKTMFLTK